MILVTGVTGTVGREVVRRLPPDIPLRLLARDPERVAAPPGAEVVRGDYGDASSLARALRGVDRAFLVITPVGGGHGAAFLRAARAAGVRHVVKLSAAAVTDAAADDLITRRQRVQEDELRGSGLEWTLLRPRSFMSNCLAWAPSVRSRGVVRALYGGSVNACIDPRDIAAVAVHALTEDGHEGRAYTLTGPEPISAVEQTRLLGEVLGVPLRFEELPPAEALATWQSRYPEQVAEALMSSARRQLEGAKAGVGQAVAEVTGRPPGSFARWAADHADAFAPPAAGAGASKAAPLRTYGTTRSPSR